MRLKDKVALISGGARGIGAETARLMAQEGAKVVIGDVLEEEGRKVEGEIRNRGGECLFVKLDVTQGEQWHRAIQAAVSRFGKLNILVNNAGILSTVGLEETTEEVWEEVMSVNVKGVFLGTKLAIPELRKAGGGSIINLSSTAGIVAARYPAYTASKFAVRGFTKIVAVKYAKDGIRVNSVHPGPVDTPMVSWQDEETTRAGLAMTPMKRRGTPEEIANGILYLASDESSYVTGSELVIDGGWTAQ